MRWIKENWQWFSVFLLIIAVLFIVNLGLDALLGADSRPELGSSIY